MVLALSKTNYMYSVLKTIARNYSGTSIHLVSRDDIHSLYRGRFTFGVLDCVRYNEDFVI